ncbi:MAG: hypothetical protein KDD34_08110, partial [Bdellovibrionales bacterium]|nr:hypothetical protein [Bdellovibrionales bacterium]
EKYRRVLSKDRQISDMRLDQRMPRNTYGLSTNSTSFALGIISLAIVAKTFEYSGYSTNYELLVAFIKDHMKVIEHSAAGLVLSAFGLQAYHAFKLTKKLKNLDYNHEMSPKKISLLSKLFPRWNNKKLTNSQTSCADILILKNPVEATH